MCKQQKKISPPQRRFFLNTKGFFLNKYHEKNEKSLSKDYTKLMERCKKKAFRRIIQNLGGAVNKKLCENIKIGNINKKRYENVLIFVE